MADRDESALSRWSRLKREAAAGQAAKEESEATASPAPPEETPPPAEADGEAPQVRVEDLPDIDELTYETDVTAFLRNGVPDALRKAALRKLWTSDPVFAVLDGLNDHDLDYTKPERLSKSLQALIPEQADPAPLGPRHEVTPGRRGPQVPRKGEAPLQADVQTKAPDSQRNQRDAAEFEQDGESTEAELQPNHTSRQGRSQRQCDKT